MAEPQEPDALPAALLPDDIAAHVVVLPAEQVSLHRVDLPVRSSRQRRAALPFALEEAVAAPIETVHFAAWGRAPDGTLLAAAVDRAVLEAAVAEAPHAPVVPEQILLAPPSDAGWTTHRAGDRVLVRTADGLGFAAHLDELESLWQISGRPSIANLAMDLPPAFKAANAPMAQAPQLSELAAYDLRQGAYRPSLGLERPMKWLAASVALAMIGHLWLAMADVQAQATLADALRQDAAAALEARLPGAQPDSDPALLNRQITAQFAPRHGSAFLPLMDVVSSAWIRDGAAVDIQQLSWSDDVLRLVIEARDLDALQGAEASLANNGLSVSSGSATADAGSARAEFLVRR